ncbi:MAG TPA: hypothetical protein ENK85_11235 [Saprospiraceae bacterium]|nr:hypothetical protein [Saprospiraceae bacterium]
MAHLSYEESKKVVFKGLIFLGVITIVEVAIALLAKGQIIEGFHLNKTFYSILMAVFSLIKALYILGEFMHLKYESKALRVGMAIPLILLVWAAIAFSQDGYTFEQRRERSGDEHFPEKPPVAEHSLHDVAH